jgi:hypothetical protein
MFRKLAEMVISGFGIAGLILIFLFFLAIGPILIIWSLNILFPALNIDFTWQTWAAILILLTFLRPEVSIKGKS